jgi:hypothetical protein
MNLLDSPDAFLGTTRANPARKYRLKTQKERQRIREYTADIVVTTRCGKCGQHVYCSLKYGREWFRTHECEAS